MVELTKSFSFWLFKYHREIYALVLFGHLEEITDEMYDDYLQWCMTEEAKPYMNQNETSRP